MEIEKAESLICGKWVAELKCGHQFVFDCKLDSPSDVVRCPICEGTED